MTFPIDLVEPEMSRKTGLHHKLHLLIYGLSLADMLERLAWREITPASRPVRHGKLATTQP